MRLDKDSFYDEAMALQMGGQDYIPHEGCTTNRKLWIYRRAKGVGGYCNKCGAKRFVPYGRRSLDKLAINRAVQKEIYTRTTDPITLPDDFTSSIPALSACWLYLAALTDPIIQSYNIGYSPSLKRVVLPCYDEAGTLTFYQARATDARLKPKYLNKGNHAKSDSLFRSWCYPGQAQPNPGGTVTVCEDILSAIRVGRYSPAVSVFGTNLSLTQANALRDFGTAILWLDADRAGQRGTTAMRSTWQWFGTVRFIRTPVDPKCCTNRRILEELHGQNAFIYNETPG